MTHECAKIAENNTHVSLHIPVPTLVQSTPPPPDLLHMDKGLKVGEHIMC